MAMRPVFRRARPILLLLVGVLVGMLLVGTAGAHTGSPTHLWREHLREKVEAFGDGRWVNEDELRDSAADFDARVSFCGSDNAPDADFECTMRLYAPQAGFVVLNGSAETWLPTAAGAGERTVSCWFKRGDTLVPGTVRDVQLDLANDQEENCSTNGGRHVRAGWHRFSFVLNIESGVEVFDVGANLVYSPYQGGYQGTD